MNPGCGHPHYSLSRGAPSATWVLLQAGQRSERDSNPRYLSVSLVFKTSAFNRSAIAPGSTSNRYDTMPSNFRQAQIFSPASRSAQNQDLSFRADLCHLAILNQVGFSSQLFHTVMYEQIASVRYCVELFPHAVRERNILEHP